MDNNGHDTDKDLDTKADEDSNNSNVTGESPDETNESIALVTVVIEDKDKEGDSNKVSVDQKTTEKKEKQKTPKKKFNVVKDFKKPNTTNVVSKLSEYLKTPVPVKPREDKNNTEEAKNKRNSMKGKIDVSKVTSKLNIKSLIDEPKKANGNHEKKESENGEKEKETPKKMVKRTPPKSKWDAIMSKIEVSKDTEKPKPEVKSKLQEILHAPPPPPPPKKEEPPKPKKKISKAIPDYSKVQSKLKYTAPPAPPKPKEENPAKNRNRRSAGSPNGSKTASPNRSIVAKNTKNPGSPSRAKSDMTKKLDSSKDSNHLGVKDNVERGRERRLSKIQNERVRSLSGDSSVKRPEIRDMAVHIDLGDSLDGRGTGSLLSSCQSSCQSSRTDMSTTEEDLYHKRKFNINCFFKKIIQYFVQIKGMKGKSHWFWVNFSLHSLATNVSLFVHVVVWQERVQQVIKSRILLFYLDSFDHKVFFLISFMFSYYKSCSDDYLK